MTEEPFVVTVTFRCRPETLEEVRTELTRNARSSAAEPGCLDFTVLADHSEQTAFLLYEVYRDKHAFTDEHRATAHYARWKAVEGRCVLPESRKLQTFTPLKVDHGREAK